MPFFRDFFHIWNLPRAHITHTPTHAHTTHTSWGYLHSLQPSTITVYVQFAIYTRPAWKLWLVLHSVVNSLYSMEHHTELKNVHRRCKKEYDRLKWNWARHVCCMDPEKWAYIATKWVHRDGQRRHDRPRRRWLGHIQEWLSRPSYWLGKLEGQERGSAVEHWQKLTKKTSVNTNFSDEIR